MENRYFPPYSWRASTQEADWDLFRWQNKKISEAVHISGKAKSFEFGRWALELPLRSVLQPERPLFVLPESSRLADHSGRSHTCLVVVGFSLKIPPLFFPDWDGNRNSRPRRRIGSMCCRSQPDSVTSPVTLSSSNDYYTCSHVVWEVRRNMLSLFCRFRLNDELITIYRRYLYVYANWIQCNRSAMVKFNGFQ